MNTLSAVGGSACIWVAAGSVFLDVLTWCHDSISIAELVSHAHQSRTTSGSQRVPCDTSAPTTEICPVHQLFPGHKGSIHRVRWSPDGSQLASASDDRTVRLWRTHRDGSASGDAPCVRVIAGHTARLWDVDFCGDVLVTGGEDRTVRLWSLSDGRQLAQLAGHQGSPGVWRTRAAGGIVASGGADSSVKLWPLEQWAHISKSSDDASSNVGSEQFGVQKWRPTLPPRPWSIAAGGNATTADTARCLAVPDANTVLVGTSGGSLLLLSLPLGSQGASWTTLFQSIHSAAVVCIAATVTHVVSEPMHPAVHLADSSGDKDKAALHILFCTTDGCAHVVHVYPAGEITCPSFEWQPHQGRLVLDIFAMSGVGSDCNFLTADGSGEIKWWSILPGIAGTEGITLRATAKPPRRSRVLSAVASPQPPLLHIGDGQGNVTVFFIPPDLFCPSTSTGPVAAHELLQVAVFRSVHGNAPVACVAVDSSCNATCITSGGREGCLQRYEFVKSALEPALERAAACAAAAADSRDNLCDSRDPGQTTHLQGGKQRGNRQAQPPQRLQPHHQPLVCSTIDRLPGISAPTHSYHLRGSSSGTSLPAVHNVVCGLQGSEFVMADLTAGLELWRVPCGGVHRPVALHLSSPQSFTFAHIQAGNVTVHRKGGGLGAATAGDGLRALPRALHMTHHGREINSIAFIGESNGDSSVTVLSGAEDGSLYRASFRHNAPPSSQRLHDCVRIGEPPMGTAVKALAASPVAGRPGCHMMITAGSKQVLSAWMLCPTVPPDAASNSDSLSRKSNASAHLPYANDAENGGTAHSHIYSHRWVCARPPILGGMRRLSLPKGVTTSAADHRILAAVVFEASATASASDCSQLDACFTAFVATAASDSAVTLLALDTLDHSWTQLASMTHHCCPVISLAHLPSPSPPSAHRQPFTVSKTRPGDAREDVRHIGAPAHQQHLLFSGATDGSIAVWDVSAVVSSSQSCASGSDKIGTSLQPLQPIMVLPAVHTAGVNAISVAWAEDGRAVIVSGGDDQALVTTMLHIPPCPAQGPGFNPRSQPFPVTEPPVSAGIAGRDLAPSSPASGPCSMPSSTCVANAHSSALRAVWTDGSLIFSCGLDQKLRCWSVRIRPCRGAACAVRGGKSCSPDVDTSDSCECTDSDKSMARWCLRTAEVSHTSHQAVQVLEPSCIDVWPVSKTRHSVEEDSKGRKYIIAVGGRGLQILTWKTRS